MKWHKFWIRKLYIKISIELGLYDETELAFIEILSIGKLNIKILSFLTQILIKIPLNKKLHYSLIKSINLLAKSNENEINYLLSVIYFNLSENKNAILFLKKAYFYNPSKYEYFKELFSLIPKLQVFKNLHVS